MFKKSTVCGAIVGALSLVGLAHADPVTLTFEGLQDSELIQDFYNGGTGSKGSRTTEPNYGIQFAADAQGLVDFPGGTGNFANQPSGVTVMFFKTGNSILNVPLGFGTGFQFNYTMITGSATVDVYADVDGQGQKLASFNLAETGSQCGNPPPVGDFCVWQFEGVTLGKGVVAKSVVFSGPANGIGFDDVTFGDVNLPTTGGNVPEPASLGLVAAALAALAASRRRA